MCDGELINQCRAAKSSSRPRIIIDPSTRHGDCWLKKSEIGPGQFFYITSGTKHLVSKIHVRVAGLAQAFEMTWNLVV